MVVRQGVSLIGTAVTLGVVHVLTGPDHLSAIATLSANVNNSNCLAFWLGIRWGIGHSTGLVTVGIVFIVLSLSNNSDEDAIHVPEHVSNVFESIVGIFMLLLGAYGIIRAWKKRPKETFAGDNTNNSSRENSSSEIGDRFVFDDPLSPVHFDEHGQQQEQQQQQPSQSRMQQRSEMEKVAAYQRDGDSNNGDASEPFSDEDSYEHERAIVHDMATVTVSAAAAARRFSCVKAKAILTRCFEKISVRTMALGAGIVHGLAGPGGVLGVIPAVQLHSAKWATLYLSCFCLSSTLTMGLFAALYGSCSARLATAGSTTTTAPSEDLGDDEALMTRPPTPPRKSSNRDFWIECLSACLSIIVGILWLVLLSIGKLDDIFG